MLPSNSSIEALIGEHDKAYCTGLSGTTVSSLHMWGPGALQPFAMLMPLTESLAQTQHITVKFMSFTCTLVHVSNTFLHTSFSKLGAVAWP